MSLWGKTDTSGDEPKFGAALNANTSATIEVYGVDATEQGVATAAGSAYAPAHAGWVAIQTYTDMHGNARVKSETLVAMGSLTGDQADDAVYADS
jgi:hypothetical protein|tara:strand:- start:1309 stop:1593 length:285 start_codon:yes stop_codon:yes gene_type:complete